MPETKYKEVQIGPKSIEIPREWGMKTAGELFEIRKDRVDPSDLDEVVDLYSMPAFDEGKEPKKEETGEIGSKKYLVPDDTLLFPKLNIRKQRFWRVKRESETKGICSTEYWPLIPQGDLDLDFYNFYFRTHEFRSHPKVSSSSSTNSHKRVNQSSFEKVKLPVPPLPEQRRIAEILSTVDEAIQQTDEIIETSKELKKGLMQDLLTKGIGHDEFKEVQLGPKKAEVPDSWNVQKIGDMASVRGGKRLPKSHDYAEGETDYPYLRVTDFKDGGIDQRELKYLREKTYEEIEQYTISDEDVFISIAGTIGVVGKVPSSLSGANLTENAAKIYEMEEIDNEYLALYLSCKLGQDQIKSLTVGSTQPKLALKRIKLISVPVPPLDEQREIAEKLSVVDKKIRQEEEYREKLEELKKGLMQDLLTGKKRMTV